MANRWPFVGRQDELVRLRSLLSSGVGALIIGEPGVGKTALARRAEEQYAEGRIAVGRIVGHAVSSGAPYEAFAGALTAAESSLLRPIEVARRVARALAGGAGPRALFIVDDAQLLDERSAQVLLQLASDGVVTVLATALDRRLPEGVERLVRDGLCEQVKLGSLTDDQVVEVVEAALGAPIDPMTARAFTERSQGNPLVLRELVTAALDASTLVRRGDAWTLSGPSPLGSGIGDLVRARLAGLPDRQRTALQAIAAGEPLAVGIAVELVGESVLDELDADRLIVVRDGLAGPEVSTAHPLHGEVLRADIPPLRLRRLRLALASKLEAVERPSAHDLVRAAVWRLESGQADDPERVLAAARAARSLSLDTAERLARRAHEASGSLQATLLLAEILTHSGRSAEAVELTAGLPPESLTTADREALVYCAALGQGLMSGDPGGGADVVAGVMAGVPEAGDQLRALYASLLAFDARFGQALDVGAPLVEDPTVHPVARTFAALGTVGAEYWLGRTRRAVEQADAVLPVAARVREALPFAAPALELLACCALLDEGELDRAEVRSRRMRQQAASEGDQFAGPRAEYLLGRIALLRGQSTTAVRHFRRCLAALTPFDASFLRHISSMLARAAAAAGDLEAAHAALDSCVDAPRMKTYEPEFELAVAALRAAELHMAEAADHAAWAAGLAADLAEWNVALAGCHDASRYGLARHVLIPMRDAVRHVDGTFAWCLLDHTSALAARDPLALDEVARRFETRGALRFAAEACAEAALLHTAAGHARPARASALRAAHLQDRCEGPPSPWLLGAAVPVSLTERERHVAGLAASGHSDGSIAAQLGISPRTVQTHLAHVYAKLGISSRTAIAAHLGEVG